MVHFVTLDKALHLHRISPPSCKYQLWLVGEPRVLDGQPVMGGVPSKGRLWLSSIWQTLDISLSADLISLHWLGEDSLSHSRLLCWETFTHSLHYSSDTLVYFFAILTYLVYLFAIVNNYMIDIHHHALWVTCEHSVKYHQILLIIQVSISKLYQYPHIHTLIETPIAVLSHPTLSLLFVGLALSHPDKNKHIGCLCKSTTELCLHALSNLFHNQCVTLLHSLLLPIMKCLEVHYLRGQAYRNSREAQPLLDVLKPDSLLSLTACLFVVLCLFHSRLRLAE